LVGADPSMTRSPRSTAPANFSRPSLTMTDPTRRCRPRRDRVCGHDDLESHAGKVLGLVAAVQRDELFIADLGLFLIAWRVRCCVGRLDAVASSRTRRAVVVGAIGARDDAITAANAVAPWVTVGPWLYPATGATVGLCGTVAPETPHRPTGRADQGVSQTAHTCGLGRSAYLLGMRFTRVAAGPPILVINRKRQV
jgi:hypothetical protein